MPATIDDLVLELRKLRTVMGDVRLLTAMQLLTTQLGSFAGSVSPVRVTAIGAVGAGSLVYRNDATRPVAVIVRDRGGNNQTMWVGKDSGMATAEGFSTASTSVTTEADPVVLLPNEALFARASTTEVVVDALVLDPIALLRRLRGLKE